MRKPRKPWAMILWILMIAAIFTILNNCSGQVSLSINSIDSKDVKFPLKDVVVEGDEGGYIAAALKGDFLKSGAVFKEEGAIVRCIYKSVKHEGSSVTEHRLACSGTEPGGLSVSSAQTREVGPPSLSEPWPPNFNTVVTHLSYYVVDDFQKQVVIQVSRRSQEQAELNHAKVVTSSAPIPTH